MSLASRRPYIAKCPRCTQCKWSPVATSQEFSPVCPSIQYGNFHSYSASGKGITAYALIEGRAPVTPEMLKSVYACTMCGACETTCRTNIGDNVDPMDTIYALREHLASAGHALPAHQTLINNLKKEGNSQGLPRQQRSDFSRHFGITDARTTAVDVLLYVGSELAYDQAQWSQYQGILDALKRNGTQFGSLAEGEIDAGGLAYDLGFTDAAKQAADELAGLIKQSRAKVVVSLCANAYAAFKNFYPRMGVSLGGVRILHISEYLADLLRSGVIKLSATTPQRVTYHDPCKLGRLSEPYTAWNGTKKLVDNVVEISVPERPVRFGNNGCYDAPRELIRAVGGVELVEMERSREFSYCCGAGAGAAEAYPDFALKTARDRLAEVASTGSNTVITACSSCSKHLQSSANKSGANLQVTTLIEFVAKNLASTTEKVR